MRKSGRNWDWVLLGLIGMCPMGAIAYYNARAEEEEKEEQNDHLAPARAPHRAFPHSVVGPAVVSLARQ